MNGIIIGTKEFPLNPGRDRVSPDAIECVVGKELKNFLNFTVFINNELSFIIKDKNIPETFSRFLNGLLPNTGKLRHTDWFKLSYSLYTIEEFQDLDFVKIIRLPGPLNIYGYLLFEDALKKASPL
jgi:hypothetical protein